MARPLWNSRQGIARQFQIARAQLLPVSSEVPQGRIKPFWKEAALRAAVDLTMTAGSMLSAGEKVSGRDL